MDAEIVIIGGGPVGLMLANLLDQRGRTALLLDALREPARRSMAIGVTPPSLDLLASLDLDQSTIASGVPIRVARVHEAGREIGVLQFSDSDDPYPFILSIPQFETTRLLRERLRTAAKAHTLYGWHVEALESKADTIRVVARETDSGRAQRITGRFAVVCEGARGELAARLGFAKAGFAYAPGFTMGDFKDRSQFGDEAHLFFGSERPVESFPLPGKMRRWIVRSDWRGQRDLHEPLHVSVTRLTGVPLDPADQRDESWFQPRRALARRFWQGRIALCGDAAHVMSPIGGQGMNTGFADAAHLAVVLDGALAGRMDVEAGMRDYQRVRGRVFRAAAARAAIGMRVGVLRGALGSAARRALVAALLRHRASHDYLARWFMMRSLPPIRVPTARQVPSYGKTHADAFHRL